MGELDQMKIPENGIEIDPEKFSAKLSLKETELALDRIRREDYFAVVADLSSLSLYIGRYHDDLRKEFKIKDKDYTSTSAKWNREENNFLVDDIFLFKPPNKVPKDVSESAPENIAKVLQRDISPLL